MHRIGKFAGPMACTMSRLRRIYLEIPVVRGRRKFQRLPPLPLYGGSRGCGTYMRVHVECAVVASAISTQTDSRNVRASSVSSLFRSLLLSSLCFSAARTPTYFTLERKPRVTLPRSAGWTGGTAIVRDIVSSRVYSARQRLSWHAVNVALPIYLPTPCALTLSCVHCENYGRHHFDCSIFARGTYIGNANTWYFHVVCRGLENDN